MSKIDLERFAEYSDQYEFVDELYKEDSTIPIRLTTDRYNGTIIRYDKIHMTEVYDDEDEATLKFEYEFIENPSEIVDNDPMFNNHIGDILVNIIINTLNERKMRIETTILKNLIHNEEYSRKVLPFLSEDFFDDETERTLYSTINKHVEEYNRLPTEEVLKITLDDLTNQNLYENCLEDKELGKCEIDNEYLVDKTEEFCQEKAVHNVIMDSIRIIDGVTRKTKRFQKYCLRTCLLVLIITLVMIG